MAKSSFKAEIVFESSFLYNFLMFFFYIIDFQLWGNQKYWKIICNIIGKDTTIIIFIKWISKYIIN